MAHENERIARENETNEAFFHVKPDPRAKLRVVTRQTREKTQKVGKFQSSGSREHGENQVRVLDGGGARRLA